MQCGFAGGQPGRRESDCWRRATPALSASSTATGATLPSFGRFVYTRIKTATQDGEFSDSLPPSPPPPHFDTLSEDRGWV